MLGVCDPQRTQSLKASPRKGTHELISLEGPGVFLAALVIEQGGTEDRTNVSLNIDGRSVVNITYALAVQLKLVQHNPYGIVLFASGSVKTLAIGFPVALRFQSELRLLVKVDEPYLAVIQAEIIHGKE